MLALLFTIVALGDGAPTSLGTDVAKWNIDETTAWLTSTLGETFPDLPTKAHQLHVNGAMLLYVTETDLIEEFGIKSGLQRRFVISKIDALRVDTNGDGVIDDEDLPLKPATKLGRSGSANLIIVKNVWNIASSILGFAASIFIIYFGTCCCLGQCFPGVPDEVCDGCRASRQKCMDYLCALCRNKDE